jgi:prepilin-type N-terminal cleavage/methylation domain-containing protein
MPNKAVRGFTLVELLAVIAVMAIVAAMAGPAIQSFAGAGTINKAINDCNQTLAGARAYALAHHTYVRVLFSQVPTSATQLTQEVVALVISPSTGGLSGTDTNGVTVDNPVGMGTPSTWPAISRPLILNNLVINNALNATPPKGPDTSGDSYPTQATATIVTAGAPVTRTIGGNAVQFTSCIQFNPSGQAEIIELTPTRYIKVGFNKPNDTKDPFLLRISGINGSIDILRKDNGVE